MHIFYCKKQSRAGGGGGVLGGVVLQEEDHEGLGSVSKGTRNTDFGSGSSLV